MANSVLAKMAVEITANTAKFNASLSDTNKKLDSFSKNITGIGKSLIAGFGAIQVASFTFEISKLAGEAQGVREAFEKLPNSIELMNRLKDATSGTVSELELMRKSVMASNFGISLEALPKLLEFASVRAKQTGQSVDYLVDSIVTGIGRKSKLILDNLGISAVQLTEALGGASTAASSIEDVANAVGAIAEKELLKMGSMSENASTKIERLSANWVNLKVAIGDSANGTGLLGGAINALNSDLVRITETINVGFKGALVSAFPFLEDMLGKVKTETQKAIDAQKKHAQVIIEVDRAMASGNPEAYINAQKQHVYYAEILAEYNKRLVDTEKTKGAEIENIVNLTEKLNLLHTDQLTLTGAQLIATNKEIKSIDEKIKKLRELGVEQAKVNPKFSDDELRQGRIAGLDRRQTPDQELNRFNIAPMDTDAITSMTSAYDGLSASIQRLNTIQAENNAKIKSNREAWAAFGSTVSDSVAQAIAADESFGKSFAKVAARMIDQLEAITIARMIANSAKFGLGAILAATAGFGIVKGLFAKLSNRKQEFASSGGFTPYGRGMTVTVRQRGTDLVGVGVEENRIRKRTRG